MELSESQNGLLGLSQNQIDSSILECAKKLHPEIIDIAYDTSSFLKWLAGDNMLTWKSIEGNYKPNARREILQLFIHSLEASNLLDTNTIKEIEERYHLPGLQHRDFLERNDGYTLENIMDFVRNSVLPIIDAKTRLAKSENLEFDNVEEIFFFVLNLLGLQKIAAYLNGKGKRYICYPITKDEIGSLDAVIKDIGIPELSSTYRRMMGSISPTNSTYILWNVAQNNGFDYKDLKKIKLTKKSSD